MAHRHRIFARYRLLLFQSAHAGQGVKRGCCPAAIATIIVSPNALDTARIIDTMMPDEAAGIKTRKAVCSFEEPSAYAPSRKLLGTAYKASSLSEEMSGTIIKPITMPGEMALKPESEGKIFVRME